MVPCSWLVKCISCRSCFVYRWAFFAYSPFRCSDVLSHCKQTCFDCKPKLPQKLITNLRPRWKALWCTWGEPKRGQDFVREGRADRMGIFLQAAKEGKYREGREARHMSEKSLKFLFFWDASCEQFSLSDQSAVIDASLWGSPSESCSNLRTRHRKINPCKPLWERNGFNISQFEQLMCTS